MNSRNHKLPRSFSVAKTSVLFTARTLVALGFMCFFLFPTSIFAATFTSRVSGNWNEPLTWNSPGAGIPIAGDVVTINSNHTVTITVNAACTSVTFVNNSTLTISGTFTLNVSGTFTMPVSAGNTPITFNVGAGIVTVGGLFKMDGGSGNASKKNDVTISTGTLNLNGGFTTATTRCNVTFSGAGVLNISGAISANPMTLTAGTGTVNYTGSTAQDIWQLITPSTAYNNLGVSGTAIKTSTGILTVPGVLTVASGGTLQLTAAGTALNYTGTVAGTGKVLYSSASAQTVSGVTYFDLEFSGAGAKTIAAGTTITVGNDWTVGSATTLTTTAAAVVTGGISGSGAITMGSGTISLAGNWTNNGTFTPGTGTVIYNGSTQTIAGLTYNNLQTSNTGVKTLAANTTANNILTIGASTTLNLSSFTLTLSAAGTPLVSNGTFTPSTSTVNFSNAGSVNIPALNYNSLNITGGPRVLANVGTSGIAAVFTPGAGAFTVTGSTVNFNGAAQTIPAFTFNDLIVSGSLAKTILTATVVNVNTIEIQNGPTLDLPGTAQLNITKP